jgi:hypothetical protein
VQRKMKKIPFFVVLTFGLTVSLTGAEARAEDYDKRQFICPIGGKKFSHDVGYSAFPLITFPDGSWLGDTQIGVQIPICPDNGLVLLPDIGKSEEELVYTDYTAAEKTQLSALIADPEYRARKSDGLYAQAYWLASKLGRPAEDRFFMVQRATWATADTALRKKLVEKLAEDGPALIDAMTADEATKLSYRRYIVNALRELGRFDAALALLDAMVATQQTIMQKPDPDSMFGPEEFAPEMRLAIAEKDDGRHPVEMLDRRMVDDICDDKLVALYGKATESTKRACKVRRDREQNEERDSEKAFAMLKDDKALDEKCATTPKVQRDGALKQACAMRQDSLDEAAGNKLILDAAKLASQCEATRENEQAGPLHFACVKYKVMLGSALAQLLLDDPQAFAIVCPGGGEPMNDMAAFVSSACISADIDLKRQYEDSHKAKLFLDLPKLDILCASTPQDRMHEINTALFGACLDRKSQLEEAAIEKRATDPSEFQKQCGRFGKTNTAGNDEDFKGEQEMCNRAYRLRENTRVRTEAEAKGLKCFQDAIYSPDRPKCVTPAKYDAEMAVGQDDPKILDMSWLNDDHPINAEAKLRAKLLIETAKREKTYPKSKPGDRN